MLTAEWVLSKVRELPEDEKRLFYTKIRSRYEICSVCKKDFDRNDALYKCPICITSTQTQAYPICPKCSSQYQSIRCPGNCGVLYCVAHWNTIDKRKCEECYKTLCSDYDKCSNFCLECFDNF